MIKNSKIKARIKNFLIGLNIVLGIFLLLLILFWLLQVRPNQIAEIEQAGHYKYYTMDNLPTVIKAIEVDLLKKQQNVAQNNKLLLDNDKLCMLEKNIAGDEAVEDKNIKDDNNIVIGCNSKYLEDILSALKKEQVIEIYFNDDSRAPLLIKIANNPTDNFIIMPVKV